MSIQKRTTKAGKTVWIARYRDKTGKEHSRSFPTQREAKAYLADQQSALRRSEWVDPAKTKITLKDLCDQWANEAVASGTKKDREFLAANLGDLKDIPLHSLDDTDLTKWVSELRTGRPWANGKKLAETNVINRIGQVRAMLGRARDKGLIPAGTGSVLKRQPTQMDAVNEREVPTSEEIQALIDHAPRWLADAIRIATLTGMRSGEVCGLLWRDVDFDRGLIRVRQQCGKRVGELEPLKTRTSRRDIPMSDRLRRELLTIGVGKPDDPVLSGAGGRGVTSRSIAAIMVDTRKNAGVRGEISFHGLRHYFASTLLAQGVTLQIVSAALGHANIAITARTYAHFMPGQAEQARAAFDVLAGNLRDSIPALRVASGGDQRV
ncbi:tyrosine-type recombinase/integrase [Corynebacterium auriscanis]|uniref:tyrosine-type recombinase/integrase n=1 Tax=Corynebacterium auriscanis TaxID=99807 RepID=UPI003CE73821